jgi:hypothetical protein
MHVSRVDRAVEHLHVVDHGSTVAAAQATAGASINDRDYSYAGGTPAAGDVLSVGAVGAER